jgi:hypothetical protein
VVVVVVVVLEGGRLEWFGLEVWPFIRWMGVSGV